MKRSAPDRNDIRMLSKCFELSGSCVVWFVIVRHCLTIDPCDHYTLPESLPQQSDATGRVVVKQLEDIHPSLTETERAVSIKTTLLILYV